MQSEQITIPISEYNALKLDELKLLALESEGVDNWCGWDDAMKSFKAMKKEDEERGARTTS